MKVIHSTLHLLDVKFLDVNRFTHILFYWENEYRSEYELNSIWSHFPIFKGKRMIIQLFNYPISRQVGVRIYIRIWKTCCNSRRTVNVMNNHISSLMCRYEFKSIIFARHLIMQNSKNDSLWIAFWAAKFLCAREWAIIIVFSENTSRYLKSDRRSSNNQISETASLFVGFWIHRFGSEEINYYWILNNGNFILVCCKNRIDWKYKSQEWALVYWDIQDDW